jgi:hypothetical protein
MGWNEVIIAAKLFYFKFEDEDKIRTGTLGISCEIELVRMHQMKVSHNNTAIKLRWFGEKSGNVLFTMGRPSGHRGTFMLNLRDNIRTCIPLLCAQLMHHHNSISFPFNMLPITKSLQNAHISRTEKELK